MEAGTTAVAAVRTERHYVGYDTDPVYIEKAKKRIEREKADLLRRRALRSRHPKAKTFKPAPFVKDSRRATSRV